MDFTKKLPINTSGLNAQLLNHAEKKQQYTFSLNNIIPSGFIPQIDGVDHAPAMKTLPLPIFKIQQPITSPMVQSGTASGTTAPKPVRANFFTDLFAARKANNE